MRDSWWLDVKLAVRILIKYPGLALAAVFGIAVAVAIAAGAFSFIYGNLLNTSLPLEEGDRIVSIEIWDSAASKPERRILWDYQVWREGLNSIKEIGAFRTVTPSLIASGAQPETVSVALMSASGFRVARVKPLIGRFLVEDDEREGAPSVVVIGADVWRNRFGSDPGILGKTIQLGSTQLSIIGVMPDGFAFPVNHHFWSPLRAGTALPEPLTGPDLMVFGRLAPGATFESAQAELETIGRRAAASFPKMYEHLRPQVSNYSNSFLGSNQRTNVTDIIVMNLIPTMLLVLVCLNVAILIYTRTTMRHGEISVRTALGASRGRIVTQLFIEALVLSVLGAIMGVVIAAVALRQVAAATLQIAAELPFWVSFKMSPEAVLYALILSIVAAAIVGVAPALKATSRRAQTNARVIGASGSGMRLGRTWTILVVAQVACAVTILPGALFTTWENLHAELADPGFAAQEFLTAQLAMDDVRSANATTGDTRQFNRRYADRQSELMRRLEAEPRVSSTTFSMSLPGDEPGALMEAQDIAEPPREVRFNRVAVNFFGAFGVPILAGRGFEAADVVHAGASSMEPRFGEAVVVNQSFAQTIFGGDALGRHIRYVGAVGGARQDVEMGRWYQIIGIVRDFPTGVSPGMNQSPLKVYHAVAPGQALPANIALRVRGGAPLGFSRRLSEVAAAVDADLQVRNTLRMDEALRREQWIRRLEAAMLGGVSLSVFLLSSAGIYALMSFTVSQRRKEIGIRIALGADRRRIIASVFSRALGQLAIGAAVGIVAAAALEKGSGNNMLRGNAAIVLPLVGFFMMAVGFIAALGPARRGLRIQPTEALRE